MNAVVFEHVRVNELPAAWRAKLSKGTLARLTQVTVRIEEEADDASAAQALSLATANPMFGMWAEREDMRDATAHVQRLRAPRLNADGSRSKK
jgi:hypothetical protein